MEHTNSNILQHFNNLHTPEYDPYYQDIKLEDRLSSATRNSQRDSIKNQAISYRKITSVNVSLKKNRSEKQKERVYDIENFDFSYSYNQELQHDYEIENYTKKTARVVLNTAIILILLLFLLLIKLSF